MMGYCRLDKIQKSAASLHGYVEHTLPLTTPAVST